MKIALVYDVIYPYSKGGVEKRLRDLATHLGDRGHIVDIYGTKEWDGSDRLAFGNVVLRGVACQLPMYTSKGTRSIRQAVVFAYRLGRRLSRERYDVVDVQNMAPLACLVTVAAAKISGSVPLVTWHEVWRRYWNQYFGWRGYIGRLAEWVIYRWAPHHVAVSKVTRRQLEEVGVVRVGLTPNGIDVEAIHLAEPSHDSTDLIYVGRLVEHKNLDLLIDALSLMKNDGQEPKVVIVGDGPIRARLQEKSAAQGLNNVSFRADIESERTVYSLLKSARLFVLPSTREGFGLAALEAAAAGLPVATISHPSNGALDLVIGHHFGLASGPTPDEYAALIREILEDGQLHRTLSEYATVAAAEYNWPRVLPSIEREYSRLAARDPKVSNL